MTERKKKILGVISAVFCLALGVLWGSQRLLKVTYATIEIEGRGGEFDGLRILHIADLHSSSPETIAVNIWDKVRELDFDIIAITGDIVDRNAYQLEPHIPYIESLALRYPVFFAEGNHDHYSMRKLRPMLEDARVVVLTDQKTVFDYNGRKIEVIGLTDYYTADLDVSSKLLTKTEMFRLLLMHQPQHIDYVDTGTSPLLALAGHTHGGQWRVPFLKTLYAPGQGFLPKYGYGLYDVGVAKLFVSKGIGSTGKMPFRIWNRPEICVLTLKAG